MDEPTGISLPLSEGILAWTNPGLVERLRSSERKCTRSDLLGLTWPRLVPDEELRVPQSTAWMSGGSTGVPALRQAWTAVENDARRRMRAGELFLSGVQVKRELTTVPQPIPGVWASELKFDLANDVVEFQRNRFTAVRISESAPGSGTNAPAMSCSSLPPITPENMRDLSDQEVLLLLEEHARRVVETADAKLVAPGKVSVMPLIVRKMRSRAEAGKLASTLAEEAKVLADWIASKVPSHQVPAVGSVKNSVRSEYASLRARSNDMMS